MKFPNAGSIQSALKILGFSTAFERRDTEPMVPTMEELDDLFIEVEEGQKTIQSEAGISIRTVDTQDSLTFETSPFQCGNIKFVRDAFDSQGFQVKPCF